MGRLTLNILLSFAQFEREVIGKRIRDKIAASKQKGMWMGGVPPLANARSSRNRKFARLRWREMDSNFRYRGTKAVDFRSIPGIAGYRRSS